MAIAYGAEPAGNVNVVVIALVAVSITDALEAHALVA
jgi:hypothetical protein